MEKVWKHWRSGWLVLGRLFIFLLIAGALCLPLRIAGFILNPKDIPLFNEGVFSWRPIVYMLFVIIIAPISFSIAQNLTGYFKTQVDESSELNSLANRNNPSE